MTHVVYEGTCNVSIHLGTIIYKLKNLTEMASIKENLAAFGGQHNGDALNNRRSRKTRSKGTASSDMPRKQQRVGKEEAIEANVTNLVTQMHLKLSVQLESLMRDAEAATYCTQFLPKERYIVKETSAGITATW